MCVCDIEEIIQSGVCSAETCRGHRVLGVWVYWVTWLCEGMRSISIHVYTLSQLSHWLPPLFVLPAGLLAFIHHGLLSDEAFYGLNDVLQIYTKSCTRLTDHLLSQVTTRFVHNGSFTLLYSIFSSSDRAHAAVSSYITQAFIMDAILTAVSGGEGQRRRVRDWVRRKEGGGERTRRTRMRGDGQNRGRGTAKEKRRT